ncbi:DMT family transporter [uncultured Roseobacter sp.]|uniref:DMT family transporter n=1 Tax=uncultured Roseobacter sp. TaxID=114847 RepID=UPI0026165AE5|nr:DMT family transporter [uncultured Roseobacter sp.]
MENLRGAALMVFAMLGFAVEDMLIKFMAVALPVGQIIGMLGVGSAILAAGILIMQGQPLFTRSMMTRAILLRAIGELIGTIGFVTAIALTPLSSASAILQATPLFVTLGAALFLQEAVGWRRWSAILVGFLGVLLIIRPGTESFSWLSLFALQGVIGLGIRDLATRRVPKETSTMQLSFLAFLVLIPAAALLIWFNGTTLVPLSPSNWVYYTIALLIGMIAYYGIVAAMRIGEVSFVTPFRYSRIIFALIVGVFVFDENPDTMTLLGASVIVASGLYTLWRERNVRANSA